MKHSAAFFLLMVRLLSALLHWLLYRAPTRQPAVVGLVIVSVALLGVAYMWEHRFKELASMTEVFNKRNK